MHVERERERERVEGVCGGGVKSFYKCQTTTGDQGLHTHTRTHTHTPAHTHS